MGWDHGYTSRETYTAHFHSEMAPNWLDFAALVKGYAPPRRREGASFRYLELACGMGFGLCLLAALYPEGRFLGIDFQPDHIAHARHLAETLGLENLRFQEADFVDLQADPSSGPIRSLSQQGLPGVVPTVIREGTAFPPWFLSPPPRLLRQAI